MIIPTVCDFYRAAARFADWAFGFSIPSPAVEHAHRVAAVPELPTAASPSEPPAAVGSPPDDGWAYCIRYLQQAANVWMAGGKQSDRDIALILRDVADELIDAARHHQARAEADQRVGARLTQK
ncbi:hypothetical protein AB0K45_09715 [Micrococcus luteus]|uniref:hypothetical protein n=1 Tax=Micrococcus luteus TaxID=1270 RepID=UPI003414D451